METRITDLLGYRLFLQVCKEGNQYEFQVKKGDPTTSGHFIAASSVCFFGWLVFETASFCVALVGLILVRLLLRHLSHHAQINIPIFIDHLFNPSIYLLDLRSTILPVKYQVMNDLCFANHAPFTVLFS